MLGQRVFRGTRPSTGYRPDIDGLRAVAVMSVVAYHLGFRAYGGFVGVDVFFVISGFLIGSLILRDLEQSRFSLLSFYERRIRRIFPALVVMMFLTACVCFYYQPHLERQSTGRSLIAATFSVSNFYFMLASSYIPSWRSEVFSPTWSLAIEEQFYIAFPILLILIRRHLPGKLKATVIALATASFLLSVFGVHLFHVATFYLPITRAWELLLGAMMGMDVFPRIESVLFRNLFAFMGLAAIVACALLYSPSVAFPGVAALPPCLGAAFIIAAGESGPSLVGGTLSCRPLVFLGLISYSLYLWHVPIVMFERFGLIHIPNASKHSLRVTELMIAILVATLSWKLVERPFRSGRLMFKGRSAFAFAAVSAVLLASLGVTLLAFQGFIERRPLHSLRPAALYGFPAATVPVRNSP